MSTTDDTTAEAAVIELLVDTRTVRAWRVGTDYDIECKEGWGDEDFDLVIETLGLQGRTDFDLSYIPETGLEIFRLPVLAEVPAQRGLGWVGKVPAAVLAPLTALAFFVEVFGEMARPTIGA